MELFSIKIRCTFQLVSTEKMESIGYTRKYYEHNKDLGKYTLR